ncbi:hypothetical protein [Azospirillum argentinense]
MRFTQILQLSSDVEHAGYTRLAMGTEGSAARIGDPTLLFHKKCDFQIINDIILFKLPGYQGNQGMQPESAPTMRRTGKRSDTNPVAATRRDTTTPHICQGVSPSSPIAFVHRHLNRLRPAS